VETRVLSIESAKLFQAAVEEAARLLKKGGLVALPTETVYGLAANAFDSGAVEKIFAVKARPSNNPIIVHVSSLEMARQCVLEWPARAELLGAQFWPGPLTFVLARAKTIPDAVSAGGPTVGVRFPMHPFMRKVIEQCGFPLAAPSANPANQLSPTTAEHVREGLGGRIPLIVDAGPTSIGIESTVLDLTVSTPCVLRAGPISATQLSKILGIQVLTGASEGGGLKSPGLLKKHYSPRARLVLAKWETQAELERIALQSGLPPAAIHIIAHAEIPQANPFGRVAIIPQDAEAYARAIYAELHRSDELGAELILAEALPAGEEWDGIRDRLTRASG
jgi:L-threonylcarbamoyladenylate synthase